MVTPYRMGAAALGWFALVVQYWLVMTGDIGPGPLGRTVNFFTYFTILTNILAVLAMTLPWLAPDGAAGRLFTRPNVRAAIMGYIIVVASVYFLVLRQLWQPQGWQFFADAALHYATPALFVVDWLLFVRKGTLTPRDALKWLIFPIGFTCWALLYGALSGFYPYPFLDVSQLGYVRVFTNVAGLIAAFVVLGLVIVALDRLFGRLSNDRSVA